MSLDFRLRKHADFQSVYKGGRKQFARQMSYFFLVRDAGEVTGPRVGLTVGKVMGKAVDRNRIKRRLRALVRVHLSLLDAADVDVVLHPRRSVLECEYEKLSSDVAEVFRAVRKAAAARRA